MTVTDTPAVTLPTPSSREIHRAALDADLKVTFDSFGEHVGSFAVHTADGHYLFSVYYSRRFPGPNTTWRPNQKARWHTTIRSGGEEISRPVALNMIRQRRIDAERAAARAAMTPAERLAVDVAECQKRIESNRTRLANTALPAHIHLAAAQNMAWWSLNLARILADSMGEEEHGRKVAHVRSQISMDLDLDRVRLNLPRQS